MGYDPVSIVRLLFAAGQSFGLMAESDKLPIITTTEAYEQCREMKCTCYGGAEYEGKYGPAMMFNGEVICPAGWGLKIEAISNFQN